MEITTIKKAIVLTSNSFSELYRLKKKKEKKKGGKKRIIADLFQRNYLIWF
jgi:hypothetical protein